MHTYLLIVKNRLWHRFKACVALDPDAESMVALIRIWIEEYVNKREKGGQK